jgi:putative zinc finger/helix-turn-helix YgiT family protein
MTHKKKNTEENLVTQDKPFPWWCPECGKREVRPAVVRHTSHIRHDGKEYVVKIPRLKVPRCKACGELVFDNDADLQISTALRNQLGLLSGGQLRENREKLGLSQRQLADHLGVAMETISRWENDMLIQTRAMDRYLRLYFGVPAARAALIETSGWETLGNRVQI